MLSRTPVLAANSGGPVETIVDGETGWLRSPNDVDEWAKVVRHALSLGDAQIKSMGDKSEARVKDMFGRGQMAKRFDEILDDIVDKKASVSAVRTVVNVVGIVGVCLLGLVASALFARMGKQTVPSGAAA
jgi:alpha-1,3/alpha-1,6-mannosyltransferase